jgi:hypothetical protein
MRISDKELRQGIELHPVIMVRTLARELLAWRKLVKRLDKLILNTYSNAQKFVWHDVEENCKQMLDIIKELQDG